jgi:phosphatidylinositol 4-kinase
LLLKAEIGLIADVISTLRELEPIGLGSLGALKSLASKHDLLLSLLDNEQMRLAVWLYPLDHERRHFFHSANSNRPQEVSMPSSCNSRINAHIYKANLLRLLECAWLEDPSLAINFSTRFQSPRLMDEVKLLLTRFPEKATAEPDALKILLGNSLPSDFSVQMKVPLTLYDLQQMLTVIVLALLETCESSDSCYLFLARI